MNRITWNSQRSSVLAAVAWIALTIIPRVPHSQVLINEFQPRGAEWIEVYNAGTENVNLDDYIIRGQVDFEAPPGTVLPPGEYLDIEIGTLDVFSDLGGETSVIDRTSGNPDDTVSYGTRGSAPLPSETTSLARAPDAAAGPVPPGDPLTDGLVWTIAYEPSRGMMNSAPDPVLGLSIRINELEVFPDGGPDRIELFNPTPVAVDVGGWSMFVAGDGQFFLTGGVIEPMEVVVRTVPSGLQLEDSELVYLFDDGKVRVDQSGFANAPPLDPDECFARMPDGSGSSLGFDFTTSDIEVRPCSIGVPNAGSVPIEFGTWGTLKARYR